jgi:hypothetical protein
MQSPLERVLAQAGIVPSSCQRSSEFSLLLCEVGDERCTVAPKTEQKRLGFSCLASLFTPRTLFYLPVCDRSTKRHGVIQFGCEANRRAEAEEAANHMVSGVISLGLALSHRIPVLTTPSHIGSNKAINYCLVSKSSEGEIRSHIGGQNQRQ